MSTVIQNQKNYRKGNLQLMGLIQSATCFCREVSLEYVLSKTAFALKQRSRAVETETKLPTMLKIFSIWLFKKSLLPC